MLSKNKIEKYCHKTYLARAIVSKMRYLFLLLWVISLPLMAQVNGQAENRERSVEEDSLRAESLVKTQRARQIYNEGVEFMRRNEWSSARRKFLEAFQLDFGFYEARFSFAVATQREGLNELAIEEFDGLLRDTLDPRIYVHRARAYRALGEDDLAMEDLQTSLKMDSTYGETWYDIGIQHFNKKEYEEALRAFNNVIRYDSMNALAWHDRGSLLRILGRPKAGMQSIRKAIRLNPYQALFYANLASAFKEINEYDSAIWAYNRALELDSANHIFLNSRGTVKAKLEDYQGAIEDYSAALRIKTDYPFAWNNRGNAYYHLRAYQDAVRDYDLAILLDPDYAKAFLNRGISRQLLRDPAGACEDWARAAGLGIGQAEHYLKLYCGHGTESRR